MTCVTDEMIYYANLRTRGNLDHFAALFTKTQSLLRASINSMRQLERAQNYQGTNVADEAVYWSMHGGHMDIDACISALAHTQSYLRQSIDFIRRMETTQINARGRK